MAYCIKCGEKVTKTRETCPSCGESLNQLTKAGAANVAPAFSVPKKKLIFDTDDLEATINVKSEIISNE